MNVRSLASRSVKRLLRRLTARLWERFNRGSLTILTYHRVTDCFDSRIHLPGTWTQTDMFREQIRAIVRRFPVVRLRDGLDDLKSGRLKEHSVAVTFDDGDAALQDRALPILEELNCPATIFVNSAYIDDNNNTSLHFPLVYRFLVNSENPELSDLVDDVGERRVHELRSTGDPNEYESVRSEIEGLSTHIPDQQKLFMTLSEIESLRPDLFHVGLHGYVHQRFSMLSDGEQAEALEKGFAALGSLEGFCPAFAIPYGGQRDWNETTLRLCPRARSYHAQLHGRAQPSLPTASRPPAGRRSGGGAARRGCLDLDSMNVLRGKVGRLMARHGLIALDRKRWVFVVGCYNSGTTLLQRILARHGNASRHILEIVHLSGPISHDSAGTDTCASPQPTLDSVFGFLDLPTVSGSVFDATWDIHGVSSKIENMNARSHQRLRPDDISEIEDVAGSLLEQLEYSPPSVHAQG